MQRPLFIAAILTLLYYQSCVCRPTNGKVGNSQEELGWRALLLVDPDSAPRPRSEEGKRRRITPKSVFIAPAFSGGSPLPDCAEGYRADSMGRCVKLVQLNHAAQLEFLLQRLNAMYASPVVRRGYDDLSTSDSQPGPLHVSIPIEIPPEPEEETKESVEVAVVMADVLKDELKNNEKSKVDKPQTIVAVWNVGKNGSSLEEVEDASDLDIQTDNEQSEKCNTTKYEVVNEMENSTTPKIKSALFEDEELLSTAPTTILVPENDVETVPEVMKTSGSAMELLEDVSNISSEDGRPGNTSRRNVSNAEHDKNRETTTEETISTESQETTTEIMKRPNSADEVQVAKETKVALETTTQRGYVRFPTERYGFGDQDNVETEGVRHNLVRFPQPWDYDKPSPPVLPSEIQQRQTFWWLPPGWRLDPTRHQPMLIRFWARMPLLRDQHSDTSDNYHDFYARRRRPPVY